MKLSGLIFIPLLLAAACSDPSFSIKGEIQDGEGKTLLLEKADNAGFWVTVDSTRLGKNGKFSFSGMSPDAPEIYRLALDDRYVYFPVDSIDRLTLNADAADFSGNFSLEGSENAVKMARFEKALHSAIPTLSIPDSAEAFKRRVFVEYLRDARGSVVSYYILTKTVDDRPLFSPSSDAKYFAAVATSFKQFRPNDPRCALLERIATEGLRKNAEASGKRKIMEAREIGYLPISLPDEAGNLAPLSEVLGKGLPVVLIFEDLSDPDTSLLNAELKTLCTSGRAKIYSVGLDADQMIWRNAARNLPFTTVYANVSDAQDVCAKYQVTDLPTIFIIGTDGTIIDRPADINALKKAL